MNELKPCPRCGGEATTSKLDSIGRWFVGCVSGHCMEIADSFEAEQEAITAWNQRVERTCTHEGSIFDEGLGEFTHYLSCGHKVYTHFQDLPNYCDECGAKVVG